MKARGAIIWAIAGVTFALLAWRAWQFVTAAAPPWAYARDIGFDYAVAEYARHLVHTPVDALDFLGWNGWYDIPQFFYNSLFEYVTLAPLTLIVHNGWTAIKVLQVLLLAGAASGAYALARVFARERCWAVLAGLIYATMPLVCLNLRAGLSVVWPSVLLPWALCFGVIAIRRFGERALPLAALLCACAGTVPHIEFLFLVSLPTYACLAAYAFDRTASRKRWLTYAVASLPLLIGPSLYLVCASLFQGVLSPSATRGAALAFPGFLTLFSQTLRETLALAPREQLVDPSGLVNASPFLYLALPGGISVWYLAYVGLRGLLARVRRTATAFLALLVVGLVLLAFGPNLEVGIPAWWLITHLPLLGELRTPDRWLTVPALAIALGAAEGLRALTRMGARLAALAAGLAVVSLASFLSFGACAHVWQAENDVAAVEPHLARVNALAAANGYRTASYAVARGGAFDDGDGYGVPTPTIFSARAFGARFGTDGIGGIGLLARAGIGTVIATPAWQRSFERYAPDFSAIYRSIPLGRTIFDARDGVYVKALPHVDPLVVADRTSCLFGGPGNLDYLLADAGLRHVDFVRPGASCAFPTYSDYQPYDALTAQDSIRWEPGVRLCPECTRLVDADAAYVVGRYELAQPWYRNAIDGDSPTFSEQGAIQLIGRAVLHAKVRVPVHRRAYTLLLRYASHAYTYLTIHVGDRPEQSFRFLPSLGLRWFDLPLAGCRRGCTVDLKIRVAPLGIGDMGYTWTGFALDGVAIVTTSTLDKLAKYGSTGAIAIGSDAFDPARDRDYALTPVAHGFRWRGKSATVVAIARAPQRYRRTLAVVVGAAAKRSATRLEHLKNTPDDVYTYATLRVVPGDRIGVTGAPRAELTLVRREPSLPTYRSQPGKRSGDLLFTDGPGVLAVVRAAGGFGRDAFTFNGLFGRRGAWLRARVLGSGKPTLFAVGAEGVLGNGAVETALRCGNKTATQLATHTSGLAILTLTSSARRCALWVKWQGSATLAHVYTRTKVLGPTWRTRTLWMPAGRYSIRQRQTDWFLGPVAPAFKLDGKRLPAGAFVIGRTGLHRLGVRLAAGSESLTLLQPLAQLRPNPLAKVKTVALGTLRSKVAVGARTGLKINHLDDGYWVLKRDGFEGRGVQCDLVATCFSNVLPGTYLLVHRWPPLLTLGFVLSFASIVVAFIPLVGVPNASAESAKARSRR